MYRPSTGPSKASASTRCQKCLQYGHYSYECKIPVKDRPYSSRPSRTQQLFNPKLQSKLSDDSPNPLLQKEGIADALLSKAEAEHARKRSPSVSSVASSDSVATISTNASRSPSPPRKRRRISAEPKARPHRDRSKGRHGDEHGGKDRAQENHSRRDDRHNGAEARSKRHEEDRYDGDRERRRRRRSPSPATASPSRHDRDTYDRGRPRRSTSPRRRVNAALRSPSPGDKQDREGSGSPRGPREGRENRRRPRSRSPPGRNGGGRGRWDQKDHRDEPRNTLRGQHRQDDGGTVTYGRPPRERSLSPFSKRAALTAALSGGR